MRFLRAQINYFNAVSKIRLLSGITHLPKKLIFKSFVLSIMLYSVCAVTFQRFLRSLTLRNDTKDTLRQPERRDSAAAPLCHPERAAEKERRRVERVFTTLARGSDTDSVAKQTVYSSRGIVPKISPLAALGRNDTGKAHTNRWKTGTACKAMLCLPSRKNKSNRL